MDAYLAAGKPQGWDFTRWEMWTYTNHERRTDEEFFRKNGHLWRDGRGEIAGLFVSEGGRDFFSVLARPGTPVIAEVMLDWAIAEWGRGKGRLKCGAYTFDKAGEALLVRRGFEAGQGLCHTWKFDLKNTAYQALLPDGFRVASILEHPDYKERCEVVSDAYNANAAGFTLEEYRWRCSAPGYRPEFDLSVISPEGVFVSCCTGWLDERSRVAVVETVGTRRAYQNRGFARQVVAECFKRLAAAGAQVALVTSYSEAAHRTYAALRPVERYDFRAYSCRPESCKRGTLGTPLRSEPGNEGGHELWTRPFGDRLWRITLPFPKVTGQLSSFPNSWRAWAPPTRSCGTA